MLPSAETVEKLSYGDPLFRMPMQSNIPITADREYLADIAGMIPFGAPAARPTARGIQDLVRQIQTEPPIGAITPKASLLDDFSSEAFGTSDPYIYHLSGNNNIESFVSGGIKASEKGMSGPGVYLARTPEETQYHSTLDDGTLYRVNKDQLIKDYGLFHYKNNPEGKVQFDETTGEILLDAKNIPPDYVEVKIGNRWMPLQKPKPETANIDTGKLPASSDDIVGNPKINEDFVDLYHVTDEDSLAKIESSGVLDNTMATSNFQGYAPAIQGTYGWSSPERARFEVDRLADMTGSTEGLVILKVRVPKSEFNRLRPDEDSGIDDWRQSYLEGGSAAIEGPIPLSFVEKVYKGE
jgi:hypothetical protein